MRGRGRLVPGMATRSRAIFTSSGTGNSFANDDHEAIASATIVSVHPPVSGGIVNTELSASNESIANKKGKLMKDLRGLVADGDDLLQELVKSSNEEFSAARAKIERRLGETSARLDHARIALTRKAGRAADATVEYVWENPWKVFGVAAAAGIIAALAFSRRRCVYLPTADEDG
jgi:ElaB/YqjD/DUF883 family membrane-anchored ribosome-binding protein